MYTIDFLEKEHEEITNIVNQVEVKCIEILNGNEINEEFFRALITYIRKYADETHHRKEEDILFKYMTENLGEAAGKLINSGMLVEHQMARLYVLELENHLNEYFKNKNDIDKIQILGNAMSYVNLLRLHINKENNVAYPFGEKNLSVELKKEIDKKMRERTEIEKEQLENKNKLLKIIFNKN